MFTIPLNLLLFCLLVAGSTDTVQAQQCRLRLQNNSMQDGINAPQPTPSPVNGTAAPSPSSAPASGNNTSVPQPFDYGNDTIRGVNLGGWFVLEPWITPSIFENTNNNNIIDEYTFGQMQNSSVALSVLQNHWDTWITEDDFIAIAAAGLNHVRIPLGYWSVPITSADTNYTTSVSPYTPGAWPYLLRALGWAKTHSIHVILDLHGAPGSQNGYDNSGQRIPVPMWPNGTNVNRTLDIMQFIAEALAGQVDIIELLNEPAGFTSASFANTIRGYWQDGYTTVRAAHGNVSQIMIGDGFLGVQSWTDFLTYPTAEGVMMDNHEYQIFSDPELSRSFSEHISFACSLIPNLVSFATNNIWTIIGEWSAAVTDCAQWLNGRGVGARWDGSYAPNQQVFGSCDGWTGNMSTFSDSYKTFLRQYWEVQVEIGESIQGWVFWTWKAENADEWSYQKGLEGGWIPQDPTDRMYPGICS